VNEAAALPEWVVRFRREQGREPRVLHIGNIANNAYLNARILRDRGIECDVACADNYHIMACPEWEDADVPAAVGSHFHPSWTRSELAGFVRPRWFAQGPELMVARYLLARRHGWRLRTALLWSALEVRRSVRARVGERPAAAAGPAREAGDEASEGPSGRRRHGSEGLDRTAQERIVDVSIGLVRRVLRRVKRIFAHAQEAFFGDAATGVEPDLAALFAERFPGRPAMTPEEGEALIARARGWSALLHRYDAVIGYATEGVLPLACGKRPYFAFEHGTIRQIPFEDDLTGRACALSYVASDEAIITNCDNEVAAKRLGIPKFRFVPHPVNERAHPDAQGRAEILGKELREKLGARFLVFHPSRHHWEERRHPSWEKGNDVLIEGFADFVEEVNGDAAAVFVKWGATLEESRKLLEQRGIAERVHWIDPLPHRRMVEMVIASDLLADQFYLGAFGSTMPKALLHGCPAMLHLDEDRHHWCFPEMPPVLRAQTPEEVTRGLLRLYREPAFAQELASEGRRWYDIYHSGDRIGRDLVDMIGTAVETPTAGG
jgi:glycosyltransferase involved in cell wall biosynthesis